MKEAFLSEICKVNPPKPTGLQSDMLCSFVPMEFVSEVSGSITQSTVRLVEEVEKGYTSFIDGDVIFAKITPCMENGKCAITTNLKNGIGFGSTEFHVLRACQEVLPEWIYFFLRQEKIRKQAASWFHGTAGQQRVPSDFLDQLKLPLPPLPEQQRIAAILQKADRLRRLRRYARQLSDGYLQSVFLEMFGDPATNPKGWQTVPANQLYEIQLGKMRSEKEITGKFLHPYLRNINVQWGYLDLTDIKEMDFTPKEMGKFLLQKGDILVCEGGEAGRTAIFNGEILNCAYQNALHRLRAKSLQINTDYFVRYMKVACDFGIIAKLTSQVTIAHFTAEKFADLQVMLPSLDLQESFSEICNKVHAMEKQQKESERQAEQLFQSLLKRAFQGEL